MNDDEIEGILAHVTGYTGWSPGNVSEQSGYYLALKVATSLEGATTTAELVGGIKGPVEMDEDMNVVFRIDDKDTQKVRFVTTKNGESLTRTFSLKGLELAE